MNIQLNEILSHDGDKRYRPRKLTPYNVCSVPRGMFITIEGFLSTVEDVPYRMGLILGNMYRGGYHEDIISAVGGRVSTNQHLPWYPSQYSDVPPPPRPHTHTHTHTHTILEMSPNGTEHLQGNEFPYANEQALYGVKLAYVQPHLSKTDLVFGTVRLQVG